MADTFESQNDVPDIVDQKRVVVIGGGPASKTSGQCRFDPGAHPTILH